MGLAKSTGPSSVASDKLMIHVHLTRHSFPLLFSEFAFVSAHNCEVGNKWSHWMMKLSDFREGEATFSIDFIPLHIEHSLLSPRFIHFGPRRIHRITHITHHHLKLHLIFSIKPLFRHRVFQPRHRPPIPLFRNWGRNIGSELIQ